MRNVGSEGPSESVLKNKKRSHTPFHVFSFLKPLWLQQDVLETINQSLLNHRLSSLPPKVTQQDWRERARMIPRTDLLLSWSIHDDLRLCRCRHICWKFGNQENSHKQTVVDEKDRRGVNEKWMMDGGYFPHQSAVEQPGASHYQRKTFKHKSQTTFVYFWHPIVREVDATHPAMMLSKNPWKDDSVRSLGTLRKKSTSLRKLAISGETFEKGMGDLLRALLEY